MFAAQHERSGGRQNSVLVFGSMHNSCSCIVHHAQRPLINEATANISSTTMLRLCISGPICILALTDVYL